MRKPIIAGNWKMHKTRDEALQFVYSVNMKVPSKEYVESVVCAQSPVLRDLVKRQGDNLRIGAQNMHYLDSGAYTGEISAPLLEDVGVSYVIIGHSERRAYYNETDAAINKKLHQAFRYGITPILCVGESLETREAGETDAFVKKQVVADLKGLGSEQVKELVIAYEPIWAIGTGKTATAEMANDTIKAIRNVVRDLYDEETADTMRIQYGGSVKPANVDELLSMSDIDGALVGGASLDPDSFLVLVNAAVKK
ncbi:triose-phosphate isomerase [Candidatus Xianfuyuplasma coldseepsis]|uniref:Triosephosphate isomerase n=1 Tax=Candidatus Xianfuyuplasma coldseepsis TaxID=2782163 RepID=A0A7L7KPE0_9MOLU|nr:triose-phosphate isomerase [Xianfuyuplasma coldseepsis]QMS84415.1 triose-phosphate isomerase [Xianfuyuplasma coldseepsis]